MEEDEEMKRQANFQAIGKVHGNDMFAAHANLLHNAKVKFAADGIKPEWVTSMVTHIVPSTHTVNEHLPLWDARVDITFDDGTEDDGH